MYALARDPVVLAVMSEDAKNKTGVELFRELKRIYTVACVEDYYWAGRWDDLVMRVDMALLLTHRRDSGAPEPVPLEEVPYPELPTDFAPSPQPAGAGAVPPSLGIARPKGWPGGGPRPKAVPETPWTGPAGELRMVEGFMGKWKLNPSRTRVSLAKLEVPRRRYVLREFETVEGVDFDDLLAQYMKDCEASGVWDEAEIPAAEAVLTKRPFQFNLWETSGVDLTKRPRLTPVASSTASALQRFAAARAAARSGAPAEQADSSAAPTQAKPLGENGLRPPLSSASSMSFAQPKPPATGLVASASGWASLRPRGPPASAWS